jgi:hypothetical protein
MISYSSDFNLTTQSRLPLSNKLSKVSYLLEMFGFMPWNGLLIWGSKSE